MPAIPHSPFLFATCQTGAEPALKSELARLRPDLRFAYSRPGFVTFKSSGQEIAADARLDSIFARAFGLSAGKAGAAEAALVGEYARKLRDAHGRKLRLHAWERDRHFPGDEPPAFVRGEWARRAAGSLRSALGDSAFASIFEKESRASDGDLVLDLVAVETDEFWFGCHVHGHDHAPVPGGRFEIELPADAPSRAYVKLEEALQWSRAPLRAGDTAIEIGSAPGGASFALLSRGLHVTGIDPGEMAPSVLGHPRYRHLSKSFIHVLPKELPRPVHWILLDMNAEPKVSLGAAERIASMVGDSLLGVVLTLKINNWGLAARIPIWLERVHGLGGERGMAKLRATQLASNRQEIVVVALTRKGALRPAA